MTESLEQLWKSFASAFASTIEGPEELTGQISKGTEARVHNHLTLLVEARVLICKILDNKDQL